MSFCFQPKQILQRDDDTVRVTIQGKMDEQIMKIALVIIPVMKEAAQRDAAVVRDFAVRFFCRIVVMRARVDDAVS